MKYQTNYTAPKDELTDSQLISGTVLLVSLVILNAILLLNWFGYIAIT